MFINAEPRYVSHGFDTFVPYQRPDVLHQRLVAMTNNGLNAWSICRPVAASAPEHWEQHLDEYSSNENFQVSYPRPRPDLQKLTDVEVHSLYGGYFQGVSPVDQSQGLNLPNVNYTSARQPQGQQPKHALATQQRYQQPAADMNVERPSPMLGHNYSQQSIGRGRGSFAEFERVRNALQNPSDQLPGDGNYATSSQASSLGSPDRYLEEGRMFGSSSVDQTSPNTVYSVYSPPRTSIEHGATPPGDVHNDMNSFRSPYWPESLRSSVEAPSLLEHQMFHDGLPRYQEQQHCNPWKVAVNPANKWESQPHTSNTVSPKMLTLSVPSMSMSLSSSGSTQGSELALSLMSAAVSDRDDPSEYSGAKSFAIAEPEIPVHRPRQVLPDGSPYARRIATVPSNDFAPSKHHQTRSKDAATSSNYLRRRSSPPRRRGVVPRDGRSVKRPASSSFKSSSTPKTSTSQRQESAPLSPTAQATHHREAKDDFLVRSKLAGMSYKDIRRQGKYTEAESTLRGRFRTLTKHKAARVRKPEWNDNDVSSHLTHWCFD